VQELGTRTSLTRAIRNLRQEATGDWYRDPWGWPEYDFLISSRGDSVRARLRSPLRPRQTAAIDVPKENFGIRPATVLDISDRVIYQMLVDALSLKLIGDLSQSSFGWRLGFKRPIFGRYAVQSRQWQGYRGAISSMAGLYDFGLKTDVSSFFAGIQPAVAADKITEICQRSSLTDDLIALLLGWDLGVARSGIPQRSSASSVLANMILAPADAHLAELSVSPRRRHILFGRPLEFARWMDDIWIFSDDPARLRSAQVDLQEIVGRIGLVLNSGKTKLLEGDDLAEAVRKIQHSAIDEALDGDNPDAQPLEELIEDTLDQAENADRSTIRYISHRMRKHRIDYRIDELLQHAGRFAHGADYLSLLFRARVRSSDVQDWLETYQASSWNLFEWSMAQFGYALPSRRRPRASIRALYSGFISSPTSSLPLLAVSAQRLASWDAEAALDVIHQRARDESSPHALRVLTLAAAQAGAPKAVLRRWLGNFDETEVTLRMLEDRSYEPPTVDRTFL
jgi:hypothetical protein